MRILVATVAVLLLLPLQAGAAPNALYGVQDDAWLVSGAGAPAQRIATLRQLGVGLVRFTLRWDRVAPSKPANARDPADPAYQWGSFDAVLRGLHAAGISALVTLYGSPGWANGGHPANWLPSTTAIADFAYAAAKRYPWVHMWTVWNEPNSRVFSVPVSPSLYVQRALNPAYLGLHAASGANLVAGGVTGPRQPPGGMSPLAFMQGMRAARARLDAYAQNPYPVTPGETPFRTPCSSCSTLTMAALPSIRSEVTRLFGAKPLWLTEYGYQTNPPDPILGVSLARQAEYVGSAALRVWEQPGVTVLVQFLVRDEPNVGGWQSGLLTAAGQAKPSYYAYQLPLAEVSRSGSSVTLWGQVRPGSGARSYVLQSSTGGRWTALGPAQRTGASGSFRRVVALPPGARVRVVVPALGLASPPLTLT
ncbi:MAG TPA: hypothetical protein VFM96_01220 [Gaiellaceae bacterium]|nr:hypothetical protein [Gaiellaceae bacterium]